MRMFPEIDEMNEANMKNFEHFDRFFEKHNFPIKLEYFEGKGRGIIAKRDIARGEVICKGNFYNFVINEKQISEFCENCLIPLDTDQTLKCQKCEEVHYCSEACKEEHHLLHKVECKTFSRLSLVRNHEFEDHMLFSGRDKLEHLTTVKFTLKLLAKRYAEEKYGQTFPVKRKKSEITFADYLHLFSSRKIMNDTDLKNEIYKIGEFVYDVVSPRLKISLDEITDLVFKIDCNTFNMDGGYAISPELCFFNHACAPNAAKWTEDHVISIIALENIPKDQEVTIPYIRLDSKNATRKKHLKQFYFECKCPNDLKNCNSEFIKKHSCTYCQYDIMVPIGTNLKCCPNCRATLEFE